MATHGPITEKRVQDALWLRLRQKQHDWMCPNYTPPGYWECDLFSVTKAGFFVEHEIKLSVSDFRADAKKMTEKFEFVDKKWAKRSEKKHDLLAAGHRKCPSRFWYVMPEGLITLDMLPSWAGLLTFEPNKYALIHGLSFHERRRAPKIHNEPCDPKVIAALGMTFYWRYWYGVRRAYDPGAPTDYMI